MINQINTDNPKCSQTLPSMRAVIVNPPNMFLSSREQELLKEALTWRLDAAQADDPIMELKLLLQKF